MSYYLEGMNLIEGQSEDFSLCKGVIAPFEESGDTNAGKKCSEVYPTMGSNADGWCERTKGCIFDGEKKSNCMKAINTDENIFYLGTDDKCEEIKDEGKCGLSFRGVGENYYRCIPTTNNDNNTFICEDPDMDGEPTCIRTGGRTIPPSVDPINTNLDDRVNKLTEQLSENFTKELMNTIEKINDRTIYKLYDNTVINNRYVAEIKKASFIDLGDPKNSDELDLLENIIINFLDLSNDKLSELFQGLGYCNVDLNVDILLTLAIFYNKSNQEFSTIRNNKLIKVDRLLNRLGMYLPDFFQKILDAMEMCPGAEDKYIVLQHIYKTMFKYNKTNVNLGIMDSVTNIFRYLKNLRTVEMIVFILAIAFVISKVFDMFRVKVDV